jgi:hypothetical protein
VTQLQIVLAVLCGLAAVLVVVQIIRDRSANNPILAVLALVEVGLLAQLVVGIVMVSRGHEGVEVVTYVGYLVGSLVILPLAALWSLSERSRGGTAVLLIGLLVVPFLFLRLHQIWSTHV